MESTEQFNNAYKTLFDRGAELTKGSIQLDGQTLGKLGFFERRRLNKAIKHFEEAFLLEPTNAAPLFYIAKIKQRLGDYEESLGWLKKANSIQPENAILSIETSSTLGMLGRHREAIVVLEEASKYYPSEPRIQSNLGLSYLLAGETDNALRTFELLVQIEPDFPTNHKLLTLTREVRLGAKPIPKSEDDIEKMI